MDPGRLGGRFENVRVTTREQSLHVREGEARDMPSTRTVMFVCLHGAAKSVIASAYLNRLSTERGLDICATAAGVEPECEIPLQVREGLLRDGLDIGDDRPRGVALEELAAAWRVVSFGCDLSHIAQPGRVVERWDDVLPVSEGFDAARDAIVGRVQRLLDGCDLAPTRDEMLSS